MKVVALILTLLAGPMLAQDRTMILASTTSTQNSGLLDFILPQFEAVSGIHVYVVAVGTGQAMRIARNGDVDALLVHHRPSEDIFIMQGFGVGRVDVMVNDFVIVGPTADPAEIAVSTSAAQAFEQIMSSQNRFVSRGDISGTHLREMDIWHDAALLPSGRWYLEVGSGMGTALNLASGLNAYILTDRGTWLSFRNRGDLTILFEGGTGMRNPYGYIRANPAQFPHVKSDEAAALGDWLISVEGQAAIGAFRINDVQLFCPDALPTPDQSQDQHRTCAANALQR
ncbi:MAG: substrate-binding domain-containing protein [Rhodobacteraceae bacterium]|nr:substrate-binding domain-containing protein [Paracoccaceae bacterium]